MTYCGYQIKPLTGKRVVAGRPVRVFRKGYYIDTKDSADKAKAAIDKVLRKYSIKRGRAV